MFYIQGLKVPVFPMSLAILIVGLTMFVITDVASDTTLREWGLMTFGRSVSWIGLVGLMMTYGSWLACERRVPTLKEAIYQPMGGLRISRTTNQYKEGDGSLALSIELDRVTRDYVRKMENPVVLRFKRGLGIRPRSAAQGANKPLNGHFRFWRRSNKQQCGATLYLRWPQPQMLARAS